MVEEEIEHSLIKGKFAEVQVFRHLLGRKHEVYIPIVDTGVDFIIEPTNKSNHKFIGIQVKMSRYQPSSDWWQWSVYKDDRRKNSSFFYVMCFDDIDQLPKQLQIKAENGLLAFVVPYDKLENEIVKSSSTWQRTGTFSISIDKVSFETGRSKWLKFLQPYLNNWNILK
jgi:hypothetical protein